MHCIVSYQGSLSMNNVLLRESQVYKKCFNIVNYIN